MLCCLLLLNIIQFIVCEDVNLGALFENDNSLEKAFTFTIDYINKNNEDGEFTFFPIVQNNLSGRDPYLTMRNACLVLEEGVVAIFGPKTLQNIDVVQSVCDVKEIPHIVTRWNYWSLRDDIMVNVYPHPPLLSTAYYQIIAFQHWKTFTVLYEDNESLLRITSLIEEAQEHEIAVQLMQLDENHTGNYRATIKRLKISEQKFIVIDCHIDNLFEVLSQLQQAGLMNENFNYVITNLDAHTENLAPFKYSNAEIIGMRLVNPDREFVQKVAEEYFADEEDFLEATAWKLRLEAALVFDAMNMFAEVFTERQKSSSVRIVTNNNSLSCSDSHSWEHGFSIVNMFKSYPYEGLTGPISFNNEGFRSNFELSIYELREGGITDIGIWNSSTGLNMSRFQYVRENDDPESLKNKFYIVQIALTEPYGMLKLTSDHLEGNDRYEGYAVDLIMKLAEMEGFNYTFIIREDKSSGSYNKTTKKASGMIGDLLDHVADLAICDFTITSDREEVVDFTVPFMSLGISILFKKPENAPPSFFSFADPFGLDTWVCLAFSFLVTSCAYFFIGRICADEWDNPYPCIEEPDYLVNQFSFANSLWFSTGAILAQGSEMEPKSFSTRMLSGVWWYFCLIMSASYTANLAAFLATENPIKLFTDLETLYNNEHNIRYGAKKGGASVRYFQNAEEGTLLRKVGDHMNEHPEDLPGENDIGVAKAENEDYAFFMESSSIEYTTQRHCNLMQYGPNLDQKGYGIAMRKGAPYRKRLSLALLQLQQTHYLDDLKKKWWEDRRGGGACSGDEQADSADPLELENLEGCFYVTIIGTVLALILVFIEHFLYILRVRKRSKIPLLEIIKAEFRAYIDFQSPSKPNLGAKSISESDESKKDEEEEEEKDKVEKKTTSRSKSKTKTRSSRSRSTSVFREQLRQRRKSMLKQKSVTPLPYGFIVHESVEKLKV